MKYFNVGDNVTCEGKKATIVRIRQPVAPNYHAIRFVSGKIRIRHYSKLSTNPL